MEQPWQWVYYTYTTLSEAILLLEPLTSNVVDFVRQGALIAMAMVMCKQMRHVNLMVGSFRYAIIHCCKLLFSEKMFIVSIVVALLLLT